MAVTFNWHNEQNNVFVAAGTSTNVGSSSALGSNGVFTSGDLLLATVVVQSDAGDTIVAPSGWTQIGSTVTDGNSNLYAFFYKIAGAAETGSYTFTWTNSKFSSWGLLDYTKASATQFDASLAAEWTSNAGTSITTGSISPAGSSDLAILIVCEAPQGGALTAPANMTQRVNVHQGNTTVTYMASDRQLAASGSFSETFTYVNTFQSGGYVLLAVTPAPLVGLLLGQTWL
jgi:hypothetical protein